MVSIALIFSACALFALSGLPPWRRASAAFLIAGALVGLAGVVAAFGSASPPALDLPWFLPWGSFSVAVDGISIVFLIPVFLLPALGSLAGASSGRPSGFFYGLLSAAMAVVVVARDGSLFLIAWEIMAISAFLAAIDKEADPEARRSGWVYLIATHAGTLFLFASFAFWNAATGSFALAPTSAIGTGMAGAVFATALVGFGFKAGLMPLHVWLPGFYSHAPGHLSGILSGVMSKMGVYGIVRMSMLLPAPEIWWGGTLLAVGAVSAVGGIAFAVGQTNLKRLLAYSSVENVGIMAMGIGLALLGRSSGRPELVTLGLGGALFHVWNHGLFKALLFFISGTIERAAGTLDMDRLGGLSARMPRTATLFAVGAVAISGLPPFNGFAGELLIYVGLFMTIGIGGGTGLPAAAVAAAALAMTGALAVAAFVKAYSSTFLGAARTGAGADAVEAPAAALAAPAILAAACAVLGVLPALAAPVLDRAVEAWTSAGQPRIVDLVPLGLVGAFSLAVAAAALLGAALVIGSRKNRKARTVTWDCGYAAPTPRMQYTSSSLGRSIVSLFKYILYPKKLDPEIRGVFPRKAAHEHEVPDTIQDRITTPFAAAFETLLPHVRKLQQGQTHSYVLYMVIFLLVLLVVGGVL